jgi:hypothetical protein
MDGKGFRDADLMLGALEGAHKVCEFTAHLNVFFISPHNRQVMLSGIQ